MARYTCSFAVSKSRENIQGFLKEVFEISRLEVVHDAGDYVMAKEKPGQVGFNQLVVVEVLIDTDDNKNSTHNFSDKGSKTYLHFIIKNEELPLQRENHCKRMSESIGEIVRAQVEAGSGSLEVVSSTTA